MPIANQTECEYKVKCEGRKKRMQKTELTNRTQTAVFWLTALVNEID